ncbi:flagellar biosynthetic protein FliO [Sphingomonas sp. RIT328]|uniref:flagellar biosynthetic protein FliO n=1 Tax=Sphingomonas sp. RIT328 TaxID=1470591 RepID=UPI00044F7ED4|nr:flagellar biosynthetic protein FliO [Sphingomonas sp. RIT328]EZP48697.1 flagellar biosynthetic protein FliO [Sphingomonas sp. RIT328]
MELLSALRAIGALALILGLLSGALWAVRRYDIKLPAGWAQPPGRARRLTLVERLALDGRRSVALIRCDEREHLVMIAPEGVVALGEAVPAIGGAHA